QGPDTLQPLHVGHENVGDDDVGLLFPDGRETASCVSGGDNLKPLTLEHGLDDCAHANVVVDDENPRHGRPTPTNPSPSSGDARTSTLGVSRCETAIQV